MAGDFKDICWTEVLRNTTKLKEWLGEKEFKIEMPKEIKSKEDNRG